MIVGSIINLIFVFKEEGNDQSKNNNCELLILSNIFKLTAYISIGLVSQGALITYYRPSKTVSEGTSIFFGIYLFGISIFLIFFVILDKINFKLNEIAIINSFFGFFLSIIGLLVSFYMVYFERNWANYSETKESNNLKKRVKFYSFLNEKKIYPYSCWQSFQKIIDFRIIISSLIYGLFQYYSFIFILYSEYLSQLNSLVQNIISIAFCSFCGILIILTGKYIQKTKNIILIFLCGSIIFCFSFFANRVLAKIKINDFFIFSLITLILNVLHIIGHSFFVGGFFAYYSLLSKKHNLFITFGFLKTCRALIHFFISSLQTEMDLEFLIIMLCLILALEYYERKYILLFSNLASETEKWKKMLLLENEKENHEVYSSG